MFFKHVYCGANTGLRVRVCCNHQFGRHLNAFLEFFQQKRVQLKNPNYFGAIKLGSRRRFLSVNKCVQKLK